MTRYRAVLVTALLILALAPAGTAGAAPVGADGYVWADQPSTVDYTVTHAWAHNSAGGDISDSEFAVLMLD